MGPAATNRFNALRPAGSLVVLLAAMYAVCSDPGAASRHLSSKYRAAYKAAEARVAKLAAEPQQSSNASLWQLLADLLQTEQPEIHPPAIEWRVPSPTGQHLPHPAAAHALLQRPPPAIV